MSGATRGHVEISSPGFQVLGDLSVTIEGERRPITAARQRCALAILLLAANRTVSATTLIDGIWGLDLPQHPDTALQIVVSRLRTSLGPAAHRLVSGSLGYRIEVTPNELDLLLVQSALAEGQARLRENDPARAATVLGGALTRWSAEPLQDLAAFPFAPAARNRLRELRASICELRNDALLAAGRHIELLETIDEWIRVEPWRERLRAQQVLALYRSGRQVDALRAYDAYRARLVEELGIEPSHELRDLHRDVLSHAPRLAIGGGPLGARIPLWTSLWLPFVGRGDEEERIFGHIREVFAGNRAMVLVEGEAGIGKTRLVLEIARRVQDDAIIVSATANDSMRPAVVALAQALAAVALQLPDEELRPCLGRWPADLVAVAPRLRERLPEVALETDADAHEAATRLISSVASCVSALSRRAPIVILLDDLHRSGAAMLRLLGRLMVLDEQQRVLVLATARSSLPHRSANLADLAEQLERRGLLDRIVLEGIPAASVERMLGRLGDQEPAAKAQLLHQVTNGQPFFVGEILQSDDWEAALVDPPASVRDFVWRRVHALGDPEAAFLLDAAALVVAFDASLIAEITGVPRATAATFIDRGVAAGVLRTAGKDTFTFVHELGRRALTDQLDEEQFALLHERIAVALERRELGAAVLAMHWRHAVGPEAAAKTSRYARRAGDDSMENLDPVTAANWYGVALNAAADEAAREELEARIAAARACMPEPSGAVSLGSATLA